MSGNDSPESLQNVLVLNYVKRKPLRDFFLGKKEVHVFLSQTPGRAVKKYGSRDNILSFGREKNNSMATYLEFSSYQVATIVL